MYVYINHILSNLLINVLFLFFDKFEYIFAFFMIFVLNAIAT